MIVLINGFEVRPGSEQAVFEAHPREGGEIP